MKVMQILCAERILLDMGTEKMTAVDLIDEIETTSFPHYVEKFVVLSVFKKEEGDNNVEDAVFKIRNNDEILFEKNYNVDFAEMEGNRTRHAIGGLVVPKPGELVVYLEKDGVTIGEFVIDVLLKKEA